MTASAALFDDQDQQENKPVNVTQEVLIPNETKGSVQMESSMEIKEFDVPEIEIPSIRLL